MGISKNQDFEEEIINIATLCRALGHPTRLQIMVLLWSKSNRNCGEIVSLIPLAQSTISKHLLELKKAGLINVKIKGKKTIYSIERTRLVILKKYFTHFLLNKSFSNDENQFYSTIDIKIEPKQNLKQYNYQFPNKNKEDNNSV
jgi:DNA-binding transcriptional ArsR family regulator